MAHTDRIYARLSELIDNSDIVEDMVIYSAAANQFYLDYVFTHEQSKLLKLDCLEKILKYMEGNKNA